MKNLSVFGFLFGLFCVTSAQGLTLTAKSDIRTGSKYYVRYSYLDPVVLQQVGITSVPGYQDDEGYCSLQVGMDWNGDHRILKKGEVLEIVGQHEEIRNAYDWNGNFVKKVTDIYSVARFNTDGLTMMIACSIDASASESNAYAPVTDRYTKAYLTTLDLFVTP
jgi:hypothetical protein